MKRTLVFPACSVTPPAPLSTRKNSLFNFIGCLMYQGCQWVITVLVVLLSGYENSGVLAYAMSIGNIFLPIATFNLRTYQVSDLKRRFTEGEYIAFRFFTVVVAFIIIIPYTMATTSDLTWVLPTLLYLLFKMDEAVCDVLSGVSQKGGRMDYIGISQFSRGVLVVVLFCLGLMVTQNLNVAILLMFVGCCAMTISYDFPHARRFGPINVAIHFSKVRELGAAGLPLVLSATFASMIVTYARQVFANQYGSTMLGYYAAVATPSVLVQAAARYLYCPALVPLASKWNDGAGLQRFMHYLIRSSIYIALGVAGMAGALLALGPHLLRLVYGNEIEPYTSLLLGMVVGTGLNTFVYYFMDVLVIMRNLRGSVIVGVFGLFACFLLAPRLETAWGMDGLNMVVILSYLIAVLSAAFFMMASIRKRRKAPSV